MSNTPLPSLSGVTFEVISYSTHQEEIESLRYVALFRRVGGSYIHGDILDEYPTTIHVGGFIENDGSVQRELIATARIRQCLQSRLALVERVAVDDMYSQMGSRVSRGVGKALMEFAELQIMQLESRSETIRLLAREATTGFYEKLGYEKTGQTSVTVDGRTVPVMSKKTY